MTEQHVIKRPSVEPAARAALVKPLRAFTTSLAALSLSVVFGAALALACAESAAAPAADTVVDDTWADTESAAVEGLPVIPEARGNKLRIGYFETATTGMREKLLIPTLERLREAFPGLDVELVGLSEFELQLGVIRREFDLFLVSSGFYTYLADAGSGAIWLATRKTPVSTVSEKAAGSVFIVRSDSDELLELADLRSKRVAAIEKSSFSGWLTALSAIGNITQYPNNFFGKVFFTGEAPEEIAEMVRSRRVEAGVLSTCELESMQLQGHAAHDEFRVLGERQVEGFACRTSTQLYPDLVMAARPDLPADWGKLAAATLLSMPMNDGWGWTVANQLNDARRVIHEYAGVMATADGRRDETTDRYKYALLIGFLILGGSVGYNILVSRVVRNRTRALVKIIDEKSALEESEKENRARLSQLERAGIVSELSSMIAHELRQPVASLINYADGLQLYLGGRGKDPMIDEATREIAEQAERVADIVERVRKYAKQKSQVHAPIDLCEVTKRAFTTFGSSADRTGVRISSDFADSAPVEGDPLELELLIVNLLKNALHAAKNAPEGKGAISIRLFADGVASDDPRWVLEVRDNGPAISDEAFKELAHPISSDKLEGLGLGLSICRVIAERHSAKLRFRRVEPHGLSAVLSMAQRREKAGVASSGDVHTAGFAD